MADSQFSFPVVELYLAGQEPKAANVYGVSQDGLQVLLCIYVPLSERHLNGGLIGSQARLLDEKGQPKTIFSCRMLPFCSKHRMAWEPGSCCPICGTGSINTLLEQI